MPGCRYFLPSFSSLLERGSLSICQLSFLLFILLLLLIIETPLSIGPVHWGPASAWQFCPRPACGKICALRAALGRLPEAGVPGSGQRMRRAGGAADPRRCGSSTCSSVPAKRTAGTRGEQRFHHHPCTCACAPPARATSASAEASMGAPHCVRVSLRLRFQAPRPGRVTSFPFDLRFNAASRKESLGLQDLRERREAAAEGAS